MSGNHYLEIFFVREFLELEIYPKEILVSQRWNHLFDFFFLLGILPKSSVVAILEVASLV